MKALLINGSPHEHGCTYTALRELADTLEAEGIETEIIQAGKTAHACNACASCKKTHRCVYDDLVNETAPKLAAADALVIGSPVYYASPAGGAISFMDRLFFSTPHIDKTMKVGASVVSCRRGGNTATFDALNKYFTICGMPVASSQYWNMVYGNTPEEVRQDKEGLQTMRTLGRNMAFLMKSIALGKAQLGLPEKEPVQQTNFHHYGIGRPPRLIPRGSVYISGNGPADAAGVGVSAGRRRLTPRWSLRFRRMSLTSGAFWWYTTTVK